LILAPLVNETLQTKRARATAQHAILVTTICGNRQANAFFPPRSGFVQQVARANRRWRCQFRCRGSRHESAVAQLSTFGSLCVAETLYKNDGVGVYLARHSRYYQIHTMKKTHRRLLVVAIGLTLVAGYFLPAIPSPKAKRHGTRINYSVNSISSFSFSISTNELASRQNQKQ
jgi:hypothetical protein